MSMEKSLLKNQVMRLRLSGMHCSACSARIEKYLNSLEEVKQASVSLATNTATIEFHDISDSFYFQSFANTSIERIKNMGFEADVLAFPSSGTCNKTTFSHTTNLKNQVMRLRLSGMHCSACSARIEKYLNSLEEVKQASVSLATNTATIEFHDISDSFDFQSFANTSIERIKNMGFEADVLTLPEKEATSKGTVSQNVDEQISNKPQERQLPHYIVEAEKELNIRRKSLIIEAILSSIIMLVAMGSHFGIPMPAFIDMHKSPINFVLIQFILTVPVLWFGRKFYIVGIRSLRQGAPNMDTLVALGTGAAFLYSVWSTYLVLVANNAHELHTALMGIYYESAAMLIALISFGKYMELRSKRKTHDAIRSLMDLSPSTATIVKHNNDMLNGDILNLQSATLIEIPVEQIKAGDYIFLKSGNQIPVDGIVCQGIATLDVSALTGEFMPVTVQEGGAVNSGSLCVGQPFYMKAERVGTDTVLAKIIALVEEAQGSKAPIAQLADYVSLYFVPFVISFAFIAGLLWYFVGDVSFAQALKIFVAVMVVACPCALGLATPMSIMVATGRAAKLGLLIKNGTVLELASKIDAIVFDKTGTLTEGKPYILKEYESPFSISNQSQNMFLRIARGLEKNSDHPISKAFLEFIEKELNKKELKTDNTIEAQEIKTSQLDDQIVFDSIEEVSGRGVYGLLTIENKQVPYYIGNLIFMQEQGISLSEEEVKIYNRIIEEGKSPLLFGQGTPLTLGENASLSISHVSDTPRLLTLFSISDTVRVESKDVIQKLHEQNIATYILSGDNKTSVLQLAQKIGVESKYVTAEVMPHDKEAFIVELQKKYNVVAMIGDGINDAPALARAHVGMVMGSGMDVAIEAGDIVLLGDVTGVLSTLRLSHATLLNIKISLFWAFFYNILLLPVAAGLLLLFGGPALSPMLAGFAMSLSSFSVVTNALRLRNFK